MENLDEKVTIKFRRKLKPDEVKAMLNNLHDKGYNFRMSQSGFFNSGSGDSEDYISKIVGQIYRQEPFGRSNIEFYSEIGDEYPNFSGARFFTTPGYDWEDISEQERSLIEDLKKDVTDYLAKL